MSECWLGWTTNVHRSKQGDRPRTTKKGGAPMRLAYAAIYELAYGLQPADMTYHHECRNTMCVRPGPGHCMPVTFAEHGLIHGEEHRARREARTHCAHGHLWAENEQWVTRSNGKRERHCKACAAEYGPKRNAQKREARARQRG